MTLNSLDLLQNLLMHYLTLHYSVLLIIYKKFHKFMKRKHSFSQFIFWQRQSFKCYNHHFHHRIHVRSLWCIIELIGLRYRLRTEFKIKTPDESYFISLETIKYIQAF